MFSPPNGEMHIHLLELFKYMKVSFENLDMQPQLSVLISLIAAPFNRKTRCASGGFIASIVNNKATLMDQSILDGLTEGYTLVKVGTSNKGIQKSLGLVAHEPEVRRHNYLCR